MKVLISDYKEHMEEDYTMTVEAIKEEMPGADISIVPYDTPEFYEKLSDADGLLTGLVPVDETLLSHTNHLKCISVSAAGYNNIDMEETKKRNIGVCHIEEYCTREVSEHAIALMMALNRNLEAYDRDITNKMWMYHMVPPRKNIDSQTLLIFGFGRIGRQTAALAKALGMSVMAVDPFVDEEVMHSMGVVKTDREEGLRKADIMINHMNLTEDNYHYFNKEAFEMMKEDALFINVGRGGCVDEDALLYALDHHQIAGAALDVLEDETPDLEKCPFVNRKDVILTPHSAFYSINSTEKRHKISGRNLGAFLAGNYEDIQGLLSK